MGGKSTRSFSGSLSPDDLQRQILRSYFIMRVGIAAIGLGFPFLLLVGGLAMHIPAQGSISAYYHATNAAGHSMRDWFVGILFAASISLGLYRGFSRAEDLLLDAAAILGVGVAVFPMPWLSDPGVEIFGLPLHYICAVSFFVSIGFVCWFCADDTLSLIKDPARQTMLKATYRTIAIVMPGSMLAAWGLNTILRTGEAIFWVETAGILAFGVYWMLKGFELRETAADEKAALGMLRQNEGVL